MIWNQTGFRLVPNQLEKDNYDPNLVRFEQESEKISLRKKSFSINQIIRNL